MTNFFHYKVGSDALLVGLRTIQITLDCRQIKDNNNIICESDFLKVIELFIVRHDNPYTLILLTSFVLEMFYMGMLTLLTWTIHHLAWIVYHL